LFPDFFQDSFWDLVYLFLKDDGDGRVAIGKAGKGETSESEHCGVVILEPQRDREQAEGLVIRASNKIQQSPTKSWESMTEVLHEVVITKATTRSVERSK
jgi:hypothetical protein